jgi:hypothetical protein
MSDFGDFDDDDAFGTEPADPEQVARKLHALRRERAIEGADFDELTLAQQTLLIAILAELIEWGRRQGVFR